jgi:hypothetical protein
VKVVVLDWAIVLKVVPSKAPTSPPGVRSWIVSTFDPTVDPALTVYVPSSQPIEPAVPNAEGATPVPNVETLIAGEVAVEPFVFPFCQGVGVAGVVVKDETTAGLLWVRLALTLMRLPWDATRVWAAASALR